MDQMASNRMDDILSSLKISEDRVDVDGSPPPSNQEDDKIVQQPISNGSTGALCKTEEGSRNCGTSNCSSSSDSSRLAWGNIGEDAMHGQSWGSPAGPDDGDELRDACGVFGCVLAKQTEPQDVNVAQTIYLGLVALQHRGQESAGIVTSEGLGAVQHNYHKGQGLVSAIFNDTALNKLKGVLGIGHTRYSTAGGRDPINTQPFMVHTRHGPLAVAHNGELVNANALRKTVLDRGVGLSTLSDSELLTQMLSLQPPKGEKDGVPDWPARVKHLMEASPTAYSLALMHEDTIYGVRDPFGNRPLCIGKLMPVGSTTNTKPSPLTNEHATSHINGHNTSHKADSESTSLPNGHDTNLNNEHTTSHCSEPELESSRPLGWVVSSESCAFQSIGAVLVREVYPGEIVEISPNGIRSLGMVSRSSRPVIEQVYEEQSEPDHFKIHTPSPPAFCIFEYVYFARPDSIFEGQQVYQVRQRCGKQLALEAPVEADLISTVPESATPAALGFSIQSDIPYLEVLCKNRYVGRTFIQPDVRSRQLAVAKKFGVISHNVSGKRVVLVDDSIVRGTTIGPLVKLLRQAGAKEVHIRIASPPICHPCYMGINIPTRGELIANSVQADDLAAKVGADSLVYLSIDGLVKAVREGVATRGPSGHCTACLDGNYPVQLEW